MCCDSQYPGISITQVTLPKHIYMKSTYRYTHSIVPCLYTVYETHFDRLSQEV